MLRKLEVDLNVPVTGTLSTQLGGMTSAGIHLTLQYSDVNRPQTITAPAGAQPYSQFRQKIGALMQAIGGSALSTGGTATSPGPAPSTAAPTAPASTVTAYGQCIQQTNGDVAKMQACAGLLNKK
jgi:hypothetical protein